MRINIIDASNYFRGLLLLIRKDHQITQPEINLMKRIGKSLSFEKGFCENAIHEILENAYIEDTPPKFSTKELAIKFIKDGLCLAFLDHAVIHPEEEKWLRSAMVENVLDMETFSRELQYAQSRSGEPPPLEIFNLTVKHF